MDEQRIQAYLSLIQDLFTCPGGEEGRILREHSDLIDEGFFRVGAQVARQLQEAGQEQQAQFLLSLLAQISGSESPTSGSEPRILQESGVLGSTATLKEYRQFLQEVLQTTFLSQGNPSVVYPLLQQNLDKLDLTFAHILQTWANQTLRGVEMNQAFDIAVVIGNFANLIQQFPLGSRSDNLEIGLVSYKITITTFTKNQAPEMWATLQHNLGRVYLHRIHGNRAENLEAAIMACQLASEVLTQQVFPEQWAALQNNLGNAYLYRIKGERANNLEEAIAAYQTALEILTREASPEQWAMTQNNVGNAYSYRIKGERANNLEEAIAAYQTALEILTREASPEQWATTQNNLGAAYLYRIKGDRANNLEEAIKLCQLALEVRTFGAFPEQWAETQNNLGNAYSQRIKKNRAENLEKAITACQSALEVYTRKAFPEQWAMAQNNLSNIYLHRKQENRAENLEKAIAACQSALEVYTRKAFPEQWAMVQNNLSNVYLYRKQENRAENLEKAIVACQSSLEVYTRKAFPEQWAGTQHNLGNAYLYRIQGQKINNLEKAIGFYQEALTIRTRQAFPQDHTQTLNNLGLTYRDLSRHHSNNPEQKQIALVNAYNTFAQALDTVEYLRGEIVSGDEAKRKLNEQWNALYQGIVEVSIELGNHNSALEYIDRSKARNLVEEIAIRETYPDGIPPEVPQQLQHLRNAIAEENQRLSQDKNPDYTHIDQLRQDYQKLAPYHPLQFDQMQALLDEETAILEWYILGDTFLTFTLTAQSLRFWQSSPEDLDNLGDWSNAYLNAYYSNKTQWQKFSPQFLATLAQILHLNDRINDLFHHFPHCKRLILIPHRFLHLFPLHALPVTRTDPDSKEQTTQSLQNWFSNGVNYAPNCQLLRQAQNRHCPHFDRLFAIQNPTKDLDFTDIEVEALQPYFDPHHILKHTAAQKAALNLDNAHCAHFSCHGYFNFNNPLLSALILTNSELPPSPPQDNPNRYLRKANGNYLDLGQCLTLTDILQLNLRECRLVTLSACETGQVQLDTTDEYISLASGFILAGASAVVSSLWAVNDLSTALLMIRFYQNLKNGETVPLALQHAQTWLREATKADLTTWGRSCLRPSVQSFLGRYLRDVEEVPFQSPFYWAAFYAVGG